ncbi:MAG: DUF370 domain-containing protein [Eubacterium sp.]|nr:DUF370 domain-containing protein [Eubacterium sp.]
MFVNIGFGNVVNTQKIISIISPDSAPAKRLLQTAKERSSVIDATQGRRTKSLLVMENDYLVLSALQPDTLAGRIEGKTTEIGDASDDEN